MKKLHDWIPVISLLMMFATILIVVFSIVTIADNYSMDTWAKENNVVIVSKESCIFDNGPFWFKGENQRMHKITLNDGRVFYMRTNLFGNEFLEYRN